ncbi:tetratricopeptide repeat protein [bacterium]|nr:tetratricopeptide repeat protein [candidate division CSSED10-310 bacterium]
MKRVLCLFLLISVLVGFHWWDPVAKWIGIGNEAFQEGDLSTAEQAYQKAKKTAPDNYLIDNNLGSVLYKKEQPEKALDQFKTAMLSKDPEVRFNAFYNAGVVQMKNGELQEAADSFWKALTIKPDDLDTKTNLELTNIMLDMMPSPTPQITPQPQSNEYSNQTPQPQTPQPDQTQPTPQMTPQTQPQSTNLPDTTPSMTPTPQSSLSSNETPIPQPTSQSVKEGEMNPDEAERLLDAIEEEELEVLRKFHQLPEVDPRDVDKDW